jgi:glycosyltransferase involved in cell wall biosynthesis
MRSVLFHRNFKGFAGSHLKVWHYFNHVRQSSSYQPCVHFSKDSMWDSTNPWSKLREFVVESWDSIRPDVIFLSGRDWEIVTPAHRDNSLVPIINLVQALKQAQPDDVRYQYLQHKAIRICVSPELSEAVRGTQKVNGPVFIIPDGIDVAELTELRAHCAKDCDLFIVAPKQRDLGRELMRYLKRRDRQIELLTDYVEREDFLLRLARARVALFLPQIREGFYLPALEAMALDTIVVCPDCVGNRSFCLPERNAFRPAYTADAITEDVEQALRMPPSSVDQILSQARQTANKHDLPFERKAFLEILEHVNELW